MKRHWKKGGDAAGISSQTGVNQINNDSQEHS